MENLFLIIPFLIIAGILVVGYFNQQRIVRAWRDLAERSGLTCEAPRFVLLQEPRVFGVYRGRSLTLDTYTTGSGRSRTTYTRIRIAVDNRANGSLALYDETIFSKIGKALGMQDIQTGDEEIDKRFILKGQPETFALGVLNSINLRQKLLQARALSIHLDGPELKFSQHGVVADVERLQFLFELLSDVADGAERAA